MLDLTKMSAKDAQHNLTVLSWLFAHQEELQSLAAKEDAEALSMNSIVSAGGFQDEDKLLKVTSTRFLPIEIQFFSDDIALEANPAADAIVALQCGEEIVYPTNDTDPIAICRVCGIDPDEAVWTSDDTY